MQDEIISLLIKNHQHQQPKRQKEFLAWDLDLVLKRLEYENNSSFENLLEKTLFLTILAFPARISEFQTLSLSKSTITEDYMILQPRIAFIPKKHFHSFCLKPIKIPNIVWNPNIVDIVSRCLTTRNYVQSSP